MPTVAVLVALLPDRPLGAPDDTPIGRAALRVASEGIDVVVGERAHDGVFEGFRARPGRWEPVRVRPDAAWDRFPSRSRPAPYRALRGGLGAVPVGNPQALDVLCTDKVAAQRHLEDAGIPMPPVEADPDRFEGRLRGWGAGFLKPRHGALGRGVRRVLPGDPLPARGEGAVRGQDDAMVLQRAVAPPDGFAGVSVRALCQRLPGGGWALAPAVARRDRVDPVVNVARSAEAVPAVDVLEPRTLAALDALCRQACDALAALPQGDLLLEAGLDFAVDPRGVPWLIEVNARPRGRLGALARRDPARFDDAHVEASARPLRFLASL